ncbi:MAG TPA: PEGA domain-containing protein [Candidatus Pacearchaeota archaeon]|nr:PEGA domain-containing protein [Candidatus Pacearchaeota archaeon]
MEKKLVKKIAFIVLVLAFLIVAPLLILNTQGYRLDLKKMKIVETGGLSIKTSVPEVSIFINDQYKNKTSNFSRDLLIQNLTPGEYKVRVEKTNYQVWEKTLNIEEKKVTKAENIYLFPKNIPFQIYKENIKDFFVSPDNKKIIFLTKNNEIVSSENKIILNPEKYFADIEKIEFFGNGNKIIIKGENSLNQPIYYYLDTTNPSSLTRLKMMEKAEDYKLEEETIVYSLDHQILRYNPSLKTSEALKTSAEAFILKDFYNLYTIENGLLVRTNLLSKNQENLTEKPLKLKEYKLFTIADKIFVFDESSSLYLFNENKKDWDLFLKTTNNFDYKTRADKVIFSNGYELWLLLLKDFDSPFFQKSGSLIFLSRFSSTINDLAWFNDDYFFYLLSNNLMISEIDNRDRINAFSVTNLPVKKFWFDEKEKLIYLLSDDNKLYVSNKIN